MLSGSTVGLQERTESQILLENSSSDSDEEEVEDCEKVLYRASFDELGEAYLQYDTIIWLVISLLLTLAWGLGLLMLLYLPVRRYVLRKDISSRKLYVTPDEIVYKARKPSFLPFLGFTKIEKHVPLSLVMDIIIEQGCLQSAYGLHTFRLESIAFGKAAAVDELQLQGISNPTLLKKVIILEASKSIQLGGKSWTSTTYGGEGEVTPRKPVGYKSQVSAFSSSPSSKQMVMNSPKSSLPASRGRFPNDLFFHKLEEVKQSVQRIESLVGRSQVPQGSS